jgi:hypothetical protein
MPKLCPNHVPLAHAPFGVIDQTLTILWPPNVLSYLEFSGEEFLVVLELKVLADIVTTLTYKHDF